MREERKKCVWFEIGLLYSLLESKRYDKEKMVETAVCIYQQRLELRMDFANIHWGFII